MLAYAGNYSTGKLLGMPYFNAILRDAAAIDDVVEQRLCIRADALFWRYGVLGSRYIFLNRSDTECFWLYRSNWVSLA